MSYFQGMSSRFFAYLFVLCMAIMVVFLPGCAVQPLVTDQYKLTGYSDKRLHCPRKIGSIFVNMPEAVVGYQTESLLYIKRPFKLMPFVHHAWVSPPAGMLLPLIVQSLSRSQCFNAIGSSPGAALADYTVEAQLIELHQNFLVTPSQMVFTVKVALIRNTNNQVVASQIMSYHVNCPTETPYGGVIAVNQETKLFTEALTHFIVTQINRDHQRGRIHSK